MFTSLEPRVYVRICQGSLSILCKHSVLSSLHNAVKHCMTDPSSGAKRFHPDFRIGRHICPLLSLFCMFMQFDVQYVCGV